MIKRSVALFVLSAACLIFICGCNTLKGAAEGAKKDWGTVEKADEWVQKNLW